MIMHIMMIRSMLANPSPPRVPSRTRLEPEAPGGTRRSLSGSATQRDFITLNRPALAVPVNFEASLSARDYNEVSQLRPFGAPPKPSPSAVCDSSAARPQSIGHVTEASAMPVWHRVLWAVSESAFPYGGSRHTLFPTDFLDFRNDSHEPLQPN